MANLSKRLDPNYSYIGRLTVNTNSLFLHLDYAVTIFTSLSIPVIIINQMDYLSIKDTKPQATAVLSFF